MSRMSDRFRETVRNLPGHGEETDNPKTNDHEIWSLLSLVAARYCPHRDGLRARAGRGTSPIGHQTPPPPKPTPETPTPTRTPTPTPTPIPTPTPTPGPAIGPEPKVNPEGLEDLGTNGPWSRVIATGIEDRETLKNDAVYFDFDSSSIKKSEESKLEDVAKFLKDHQEDALRVEGR